MYRKNSKFNKGLIIGGFSLLFVILLTISLYLNRNTLVVESIFKDVSSFFNKVIMMPFTSFNDSKNIDQSKSYLIQKNVNDSLVKEIDELKELLELNKTLTGYDVSNATILSRNKSYWFNNLSIDKGKNDGIKKDMAVVTKNGLVGKISKVYSNSSEVKLITSDDVNYKVSVMIKTGSGDSYAILNGYDKDSGCVIVGGVDKLSDVKEGDTILTSGVGSMFPRGIYVGVVKKVQSDKYDLSKTLYIETKEDFNNIHYVTVLKEKNNGS